MRNIADVIARIEAQVPADGSQFDLSAQLDSIRESAAHAAPEAIGMWWNALVRAVNQALPFPPAEPWQAAVGAIIRGDDEP